MPRSSKNQRLVNGPRLELLEDRLTPASIAVVDTIQHWYGVTLDRGTDPQGLAYYSTQLENGAAPEVVVGQILSSREHYEKVVTGYYAGILERQADAAGLAAHVAALGSGVNEERLVASFFASPEKSQALTDGAFVEMLYRSVLNRASDLAGATANQQALAAGVSRETLALSFLESHEAATAVVDRLYSLVLGRLPNTAEEQGWVGLLQRNNFSYADAMIGFLTSVEAQARLAGDFTPLMIVTEPSVFFWQKNIGLSGLDGVVEPAAPLTLNPRVQLSHFGQDIAFTETAIGVASIPVTNGGSGYTSVPHVKIDAPAAGGGTAATATATIKNGVVTGYTLGNNAIIPGQPGPYSDTNPPIITIEGTNQTASFSANLLNGYLDYINNFIGGYGYDSIPKVTVKGAQNPVDDATIVIQPTGNPNGGAKGDPTFPGISNGVITSIIVDNPGQGYAQGEAVTVKVDPVLAGGVNGILGPVTAGSVIVASEAKFKAWAKDYISFVANTGVSTAIINIGDWEADTKGFYNYLNPALGINNVPWIVTDFLEPLGRLQKQDGTPADIQVGACAYLKDAWHLYGNGTNNGKEDPNNVNFESNVFITDGKPGSPPKNNMYQAFELINDINSKATNKFLTYFEFDGEGGGAFVGDTNYGFDGNTAPSPSQYTYQPTTSPTVQGTGTWPKTGTGYTKWLWNHFMPGVAAADIAPGGQVPQAIAPDVVWSDTEAMDPLTWSANKYSNGVPYAYGSISYTQPAWFVNSLGPVRAYSENYWWGENNYMPGPPSAITLAGQNSSVPFIISVTDTTTYTGIPTITFKTPTWPGPNGTTITGTPAAAYAVLADGSIDVVQPASGPATIPDPTGLIQLNNGTGYSTGIWVSVFPTEDNGYSNTDSISFPNNNSGGRAATGTLDVANGKLTGVTITDPGAGWLSEPTDYLINGLPDKNKNTPKQATFLPLLRAIDGFPTLTFQAPAGDGKPAQGYALVTSQTYKPGSITGFVITDPGDGYLPTKNTTLDGLSTAQLVATISNGVVSAVNVLNGGSGYTSPPTITFSNPYQITPATPATAEAVLGNNGEVTSVKIINSGAGYTPNDKTNAVPPVKADPPTSGTNSGVQMVISNTPVAPSILSQYIKTSGPTTFSAAGIPLEPINGDKYGFYLPVSHGAGAIDHIVVTRLGDHYSADNPSSMPTYTISGNGLTSNPLVVSINASTYNKAYAPIFALDGSYIIDGNGLSLVGIIDPGTGYSAGAVVSFAGQYTARPTVVFTPQVGDTGTGATGIAIIDPNTKNLLSVQIINPGSGYLKEPTISFTRNSADHTLESPTNTAIATAYVMNYPAVTIGGGRAEHKPAQAYALTTPVDTKAGDTPNYTTGYYVKSILFTDLGSGYVPVSTLGTPPALTPDDIASLPTMTVSTPSGGSPAIVDGQFAIASKWNAFWLDGSGSITKQTGLAPLALPEAVGSVQVTAGGSGYGPDAIVKFSPPAQGGEAAVGYVVLYTDGPLKGSVNRIAITNPGSGYTSVPTATILSPSNTGTGASLNVNLLIPKIRGGGNFYNYTIWNGTPSDQVTSIDFVPVQNDGSHTTGGNVYQNGADYKVNDTVVFTRNPADQPAPVSQTYVDAVAVVSKVDSTTGAILAFSITNGGTGYQSAPTAIVFSKTGKGSGAVIQPSLQNLILSANGADAVYAHYQAFPQALAQMFNDPLYTAEPLPKLGSRYYHKLDLQQDNTQLASIPKNSNGIGQGGLATFSLESVLLSNTGPEAVKLGAVQVANAVATVQNGVVTQVALAQNDTGGLNYTYPPQVVFSGPGTGASATATIVGGKVTGFTNIVGGTGYTTAPTVTLASGCLDSKYHDAVDLNIVNGLGGTFGGLSMLTYNHFITFLNTSADIIVGSQKSIGINVTGSDYTLPAGNKVSFTGNPDAANIRVGMVVEGPNVPAGTTVTSIGKATATATLNTGNGKWTIAVDPSPNNMGYSESAPPNVVITGDGNGATAKATVLNGVVTGIILDPTAATFEPYTKMSVSIGQGSTIELNNPLPPNPGALLFYNPISANDVTFSIYDSAFLPLSWLDGQVTNGWKEHNTAPTFSNLLTTGTVAPNALAGTVIYTALAADNDVLAANYRITYDLKRGQGDDASLFKINPSSGQVMLRYAASQFPRQSYAFTVVATDGGGLSVEKTVTVPVATA